MKAKKRITEVPDTIEVVIILPGVIKIPEDTFPHFRSVFKMVIMADTVKRIEKEAFFSCTILSYVRLSRNLEYIGAFAFRECESLSSIFVPPSYREIGAYAFYKCTKLIILSVSQHTQLGSEVISKTRLELLAVPRICPQCYSYKIKNVNMENEFDLHRECASDNPSEEVIYAIFKDRGQKCFQLKNNIGITASRYLYENPYTDITEQKLTNRFVLDMMGEFVN